MQPTRILGATGATKQRPLASTLSPTWAEGPGLHLPSGTVHGTAEVRLRAIRGEQVPPSGTRRVVLSLRVPAADGTNLRLAYPWVIRIEQGENGPVVYDDQLLMFGQGPTLDEALVDYGAAVLDYFETLRDDEAAGVLGVNQRPHLLLLRRLLARSHG
jgi:hypothetical protein